MKTKHPEIFFTLLIFIVGLILVLIIPAGANYDEETYMGRIWEMGLGHIMPNSHLAEGPNMPNGFLTVSYRRQVNLPVIDMDTWKRQWEIKIDWDDFEKHQTRAVYFPTLFMVQAVIMRLFGAHWHFPVLALYYMLRFSYLVMYCLLVYFAIKTIPFGKWLLGILSAAPMCLIQAASVSSDAVIFGVAYLFIAWVIHLATDPVKGMSKKQLLITCLLIIAIGTLKPNTIFLLLLLVIIPRQKINNNKTRLVLIGMTIISIALSVGWSAIASTYFTGREDTNVDTMGQFVSLFTNPLVFFKDLWLTLSTSIRAFYFQAVGVSGYGNWVMPPIVYWLYPIVILLAFFTEQEEIKLTIRQRILVFLTGLINFLAIFVIFFVVETPEGYQGIWGVQGRYFVPFFPLLLLPLLKRYKIQLPKFLPGIALSLVSLACAGVLFMDYHVVCGPSWFSKQACVLPYYKNWDQSTFWNIQMDNETRIRQNLVVQCEQLSHIQVWVNHKDQNATGKIFFLLETMEFEPLQSQWIEAKNIPEYGWMTIPLDPVVQMQNQEIQFEIMHKDGYSIPGLHLAYFPTNEYSRGVIWLNDKGQASDLVFKYGCLDGLSTILKK